MINIFFEKKEELLAVEIYNKQKMELLHQKIKHNLNRKNDRVTRLIIPYFYHSFLNVSNYFLPIDVFDIVKINDMNGVHIRNSNRKYILMMEEVIKQGLSTKNYHLVRQVLLSVDFFSEIDSLLGEQMKQFYSCIHAIHLSENHSIDIREGALYFLLHAGSCLVSRNLKELHAKAKPIPSMRKSVNKNQQALPPISFDRVEVPAESLINLRNWLSDNNRTIKYFCASEGSTTILVLESKRLPFSLYLAIKQYLTEKFKMISKFQLFRQISKSILHSYIEEFLYTKVCFNQYLYNNKKRSDYIFLLKKGQVQISNSSNHKLIVTAPILLGDEKIDSNESAKCLSDYCIAYRLKKSTLSEMVKQNFHEVEKDTEKYTKSHESCLRTEYLREWKYEKPESRNEEYFLSHTKYATGHVQSEDRGKNNALREYFSNFLNEKYDRFYEKKAKFVKSIGMNENQPVLYMIKKQIPKMPDYYKMKQKLKAARIRKTFDFRTKVEKKSSISLFKFEASTCSLENDTPYPEYNTSMPPILSSHGKMR